MRLAAKLAIAFLVVAVTAVLIVAFTTRLMIRDIASDFETRVQENTSAELVIDYYTQNGRWPSNNEVRQFLRGDRLSIAVVDEKGDIIFPNLPGRSRSLPNNFRGSKKPIEINGEFIGYMVSFQQQPPSPAEARLREEVSAAQQEFIGGVQRTLVASVIGASLFSLVLGAIVARSMAQPLQELTKATRAVAKGDLNQKVPVYANDEIGELAQAFNDMNSELAQSQQLREQMTADIAHDLRTPLSVILGHAEGLKDGILPPDQATFSLIHSESLRLNRLVEDLRMLSLADAGKLPLYRREVDVAEILARATATHTPQADAKNITLNTELESNLPTVSVDSDRIAQVLDNLIANAIRHTPMGGAITLGATCEGKTVELTVSDTGEGIPAEILPTIFERFTRSDQARGRSNGNSGLGLSIAKSIVEQHGGSIRVASEVGKGAKFSVILPQPFSKKVELIKS